MQSAENGLPVYPCCEHCVPDVSGACWAVRVGHGAYCLDCQSPESRVLPPAVHDHPPYRPVCNERRLPNGQLRGACLNDDGTSVIPPADGGAYEHGSGAASARRMTNPAWSLPPVIMCICTRWDHAGKPNAPDEHPWEPGEGKCPDTCVLPPADGGQR